MAESAGGAVHVAEGAPRQALAPLRNALTIWDDLNAPYEAALVRVLLGRACDALGDADGARMEWDAAARVFRQCGAAPALAAVEAMTRGSVAAGRTSPGASPAAPPETGGLTSRELEVLRLIAQGKTNREIARELDISEKTVARHASNIFTKLDLSTRAAATAYAFTHHLVS
jgi:DNA-binding CsgD family transcriptional regulator